MKASLGSTVRENSAARSVPLRREKETGMGVRTTPWEGREAETLSPDWRTRKEGSSKVVVVVVDDGVAGAEEESSVARHHLTTYLPAVIS